MGRLSRWTLILAACGTASLAAAPGALATPTRATCPTPPKGVKDGRDVLCAFVSVPQRHEVRSAVRYRVAISVVKSQKRSTRRPLVVLGGGPGESVAENGPLIAGRANRRSLLGRLNEKRDLILIDQRGSGSSTPSLACTPEERALAVTADDAANVAAGARAYSACAARLKTSGIDVGTFTTSQIAHDVHRVVGELKLGRVDVLAASHGTKVALLAASRGDRWLGRMVLASAIAPGANFVTEAAANFTRALDATFAACKREPACARRHPDPARRLEQAIAGLQAKPLTSRAPARTRASAPGRMAGFAPPAPGGGTFDVVGRRALARASRSGSSAITAGQAATTLYSLFYHPLGVGLVPTIIDLLAARDPKLLSDSDDSEVSGLDIATGQFFSVACAEELAGQTPAALRQAAAPFGAAARQLVESNLQIGVGAPQICAAFGVPRTFAKPADLTRIHRPTLIVAGAFDQVTPPSYGAAVAKAIRGARLLTLPAGHSPLTQVGACGYKAVSRFLDARRVLGGCAG